MIKMKNRNSGNDMWVADNRVEEYLKAGHVLAEKKPSTKSKAPKKTAPKK